MPLFIDIHEIPGVTSQAAADAHIKDIDAQGPFDVEFTKYWINEQTGKIFCLCEAPSAEAAESVHMLAHGAGASRMMEVNPELAELFMGPSQADAGGAVLLPSHTFEPQHDTATRTVMFTDIVDSTSMTQRFGDIGAFDLIQIHDRVVREAIASNEGREVKHTGDGIMAAFYSSAQAIRCAIETQKALERYCEAHPERPLDVRIGLAAGEPIEHHNDFFGATVQLAARLCTHAEARQILCCSGVAEMCAGNAITFADMGDVSLRGFAQAVRVYRVNALAS